MIHLGKDSPEKTPPDAHDNQCTLRSTPLVPNQQHLDPPQNETSDYMGDFNLSSLVPDQGSVICKM